VRSVASAVATLLDGVIARSLTLLHVPGTASTLIGAVAGGVMNWLLNRHWAFRSRGAVGREAFRYALVSADAALLNTLGVAWLEAQQPQNTPTRVTNHAPRKPRRHCWRARLALARACCGSMESALRMLSDLLGCSARYPGWRAGIRTRGTTRM